MTQLWAHSHSRHPLCPTPRERTAAQTQAMLTETAATLNAYVVEDNPVIRDNLVATLEELVPMHLVGSSADEAGAVRWLDTPHERCELIIVDLFLHSGSGLGVLKALQARNLPLRPVVLSNYASPQMRRKCLELGAERVFDKSCDIDELVAYCAALPPQELEAATE